jgi:ABC-2 type transport system ATP-binding protein
MAMNGLNVKVRGLSQRFGRTEVLKDIDLEIGKGVFGLLGPNGAGKTTLLRTLATAIDPAAGTMQLLGYDPAHHEQLRSFRRKLGYLPQSFGYYPGFTVWEFIEYFALLKEVPIGQVARKVQAAIEDVGLEDLARKKLKTLSGGMLRRVGIAQALVNNPDLLLLDEPTAGLDPEERVRFRNLIRRIGEHGTVIVSTHLVEDVGAACTSVALMSEGRIVFRGTPEELKTLDDGSAAGDSSLERGYTMALKASRQKAKA